MPDQYEEARPETQTGQGDQHSQGFFINLPLNFVKFFKLLGCKIAAFFCAIGRGFKTYGVGFAKGDWSTKISYVIMGFGCMVKGQIIKGLLFLATEIGYIFFMVFFAWDKYLSNFFSLGTAAQIREMDYNTGVETVKQDQHRVVARFYSFNTGVIVHFPDLRGSTQGQEI